MAIATSFYFYLPANIIIRKIKIKITATSRCSNCCIGTLQLFHRDVANSCLKSRRRGYGEIYQRSLMLSFVNITPL